MQHMTFAELLANKRGEPGTIAMSNGTVAGSKMHLIGAKLNLENSKIRPDDAQYAFAQRLLTEITGLAFTDAQTRMLLDLNPASRIAIVTSRGVPEPHYSDCIRQGLRFAAAHFFLMCSWPEWEPGEQLDAFKALLIKQAVAIGFGKVQLQDDANGHLEHE